MAHAVETPCNVLSYVEFNKLIVKGSTKIVSCRLIGSAFYNLGWFPDKILLLLCQMSVVMLIIY